jgi:hypothetical protein
VFVASFAEQLDGDDFDALAIEHACADLRSTAFSNGETFLRPDSLRGEETHVEVCVFEVDLVPLCPGDLAEDRMLSATRLVLQPRHSGVKIGQALFGRSWWGQHSKSELGWQFYASRHRSANQLFIEDPGYQAHDQGKGLWETVDRAVKRDREVLEDLTWRPIAERFHWTGS